MELLKKQLDATTDKVLKAMEDRETIFVNEEFFRYFQALVGMHHQLFKSVQLTESMLGKSSQYRLEFLD